MKKARFFKGYPKRSKYGAKKTVLDGISFDSQKEANRYAELKLMERSGIIQQLVLQPKYVLQPSFVHDGKKYREIYYQADFEYKEKGQSIVEDVKGFKTKEYQIKKKLFLYQYRDKIFRET